MAVHQLGGEADGVGGDGVLAGEVEVPVAEGAGDHLEAQGGKEGVPEGQQFVKVQAHGQADLPPGPGDRAVALEPLQLPLVQIQRIVRRLAGDRAFAPVAADVLPALPEGVHRQAAVVGAEAAVHRLDLVGEGRQGLGAQDAAEALLPLQSRHLYGVEGGAVGPHQTGDVGAHHLHPQFLLKGTEDGVIIKGTPLDHDVPPQFRGVGGPDHLVKGVFHHADGQPGGDILHAGPVLLGLLDAGVHKDGAAAAQVHRVLGKQAQVGKVLDGVAQRLGKGLQKAAAAGGTCLVEEDVVDGPVFDLEALHVLAADVDDEVHVGHELFGGGEVGHRLHHPVVHPKGPLDDLLPVAGDRPGGDPHVRLEGVQFLQKGLDQGDGVAGILLVLGVEHPPLPVGDHRLDGGGTGVDADEHRLGDVLQPAAGDGVAPMALGEGHVLLFALEQGRDDGVLPPAPVGGQLLQGVGDIGLPLPAPGGPQGHVVEGVFRAAAGEAQGLVKTFPQLGQEGEGAPQVQHLPLDTPPLGQPGDGLVHHRPEDTGGHVLLPGPLVQQGLDVGLGKDTAAAGDGVGALGLLRQLVHLRRGHLQQGGHLVDKGPGAAGAGAVHPHLHTAGEEEDLGVLSPQFDDGVGAGGQAGGGGPGGVHLLDKGDAAALGHPHPGGAGDGKGGGAAQ